MKSLFILFSFIFAQASIADTLIKTCKSQIKMPVQDSSETSDTVDTKPVFNILHATNEIYETQEGLVAKVSLIIEGQPGSAEQNHKVVLHEDSVRDGLSALNDYEDLNQVEKFIYHALLIAGDPETNKIYTAGFDLSKVRSAKVYQIGEATNFGSGGIVEAKDGNGKDLGSFMGGFVVAPCE